MLRLDHAEDGSVDYIADVILAERDKPPVRGYVNGVYVPTTAKWPRFLVIEVNRQQRRYCGAPDGVCDVLSMLLMDGSDVIFRAFTTVSLGLLLRKKEIIAGCSLIVKDHGFLWLNRTVEDGMRCAMIIKEMEWVMPPNYKTPMRFRKGWKENECANKPSAGVCSVLEEYKTTLVECAALETVRHTWAIGFTCVIGRRQPIAGALRLANRLNRDNGDFVVNDDLRSTWKRRRGASPGAPISWCETQCPCVTMFGLGQCLIKMFPLEDVDMEEVGFAIQECVRKKYRVSLEVDSCPGVHISATGRQQKWWLRWWYEVNYYQCLAMGATMPDCVVTKIDNWKL